MIYTVITNIEKMDCRYIRQSEAFISEKIVQYIKNTTNAEQRKARFCAYSSLFFALQRIFDESNADICFSGDGKPYPINTKGKIYISISHCDEFSAVCLSDDCEVGIDIQEEINSERAGRLENRFFKDLKLQNNLYLENKILVFKFSQGNPTLNENFEKDFSFTESVGDFTEKWSLAESLLKCEGTGFKDATDVDKIQSQCNSATMRIKTEKNEFAMSISIKRL